MRTPFHIPDESVQRAFECLRDNEHAKARAAYEFTEKNLKVVLARASLEANGQTVGQREASALTSETYLAALEAFRTVAETYYECRDRREAAAAVIDAWRTQQSDQRAMGRVAA
jgi:hypothetical protein